MADPDPLIKIRRFERDLQTQRISDIAKLANDIQAETGASRTEALIAAEKLYARIEVAR
jgi:hypothetical protein